MLRPAPVSACTQPTSSMLRGAWRRKGRFPSTSVTVGADQFGPVWCKLRSLFSNGLQEQHRCREAALGALQAQAALDPVGPARGHEQLEWTGARWYDLRFSNKSGGSSRG